MGWRSKFGQLKRDASIWFGAIPKAGLVLEIGSGDAPFLRSDVLCDKFVEDNTERGGGLIIDRPFIVGDIYNLPFHDKAFDYAICHHVLEHLNDPVVAAAELSRVAKAGSVRVPSKLAEKLAGSVYHRWMITDREGELYFELKPRPVFDDDIKQFVRKKLTAGLKYAPFYDDYRLELEVQHLWTDALLVQTDRSLDPSQVAGFTNSVQDRDILWQPLRLDQAKPKGLKRCMQSQLSRLLRWLLGPRCLDLVALMRCPGCHGAVHKAGGLIVCKECATKYPLHGATPVLVLEAARRGDLP